MKFSQTELHLQRYLSQDLMIDGEKSTPYKRLYDIDDKSGKKRGKHLSKSGN